MRLFEVHTADLVWLAIGIAVGIMVMEFWIAMTDPWWYAPANPPALPLPLGTI